MATFDHPYTTTGNVSLTDLEKIVPCVQGGKVLGRVDANTVNAEIMVRMGAMGMEFTGTVTVTSQSPVTMVVKATEKGGQGSADATVTFNGSGSGTLHTVASVSGKAASMGEGAISGVLDAMIKDFINKLAAL